MSRRKKDAASQILNNPFPYSDTNKRYHTISYYFKHECGLKMAKIPLNAGFTCPNRDGTKGAGGCSFCSAKGSGDSIEQYNQSLWQQYQAGLERARRKWPQAAGIPYFQSFSNTYAPLKQLQSLYLPFLQDPHTAQIAIATRPDCLDETFVQWLDQNRNGKTIWIELGLQSVWDETMNQLNRGHEGWEVFEAIEMCRKYHLKTCVHIINGLPGETKEMMLETARQCAASKADAIKIHMLHLIQGTQLEAQYRLDPFPLLSLEEYVSIVCDQLELLPPGMIVERVTGDGMEQDLTAPLWTKKKTIAANEIDKELQRRNSWQGKFFQESRQ